MFGIRGIATKCKDCYFDRLAIQFAIFSTIGTWPKVYILYIYTKYNTEPRSYSEIFKLVLRCSESKTSVCCSTHCRCAGTERYFHMKSGEDKTLSEINIFSVVLWFL